MTVARPFIKFVGGKTVLLPEILKRLPKKIGTYYEPCVGGGAVFFALAAEERFKSAVLGDVNHELVAAYAAIRDEPGSLIRRLATHADQHSKAYYYAVRASECRTLLDRAARFIYLNRTCFNGLYRVNQRGEFNVPVGDYKNPTICDVDNLYAASEPLRGVPVDPYEFQVTVIGAKRGDAVYFDPPYAPVSKTSNFTAYSAGGFGPDDQERLRDVAKRLIDRGVHVLLSNSDTPVVRKLYKGFKIEKVQAPRRVNSQASKRGNVGELLISGRNRSK